LPDPTGRQTRAVGPQRRSADQDWPDRPRANGLGRVRPAMPVVVDRERGR
jgi:hypothetical protein